MSRRAIAGSRFGLSLIPRKRGGRGRRAEAISRGILLMRVF